MSLQKHLLNSLPEPGPQVSVVLDGAAALATSGEFLIELLNRSHRKVPQVCYHQQLGPLQTCDTCFVKVNGNLVRACATQVTEGMQIASAGEAVDIAQREAFDRILQNHSLYCTVCDNNNQNCTIHNTTADLDVKHQARPFRSKPFEQDLSNPFYRYDPDQCILCGRCVEACQNVQVNETLTIDWGGRASSRAVGWWRTNCRIELCIVRPLRHGLPLQCPHGKVHDRARRLYHRPQSKTLDDMIRVVKDVEPETGYGPILAISELEADMREARIKRTKTVCTYCGVGCAFDVWTRDRHILKIEPGAGPANGISTCIKGKFAWDFINSEKRLTTPLIRKGDTFVEASWDEALSLIATKFTEIKAAHGPDALAFIASSKCTNEESYLMQKLARAVIGTNNIDNCSRYCQTPATMGLQRTVNMVATLVRLPTLKRPAWCSLSVRTLQRVTRCSPHASSALTSCGGQRLIVADLRKHEMAERADLFIRPNPSTDPVWINAVARYLIENIWPTRSS